MNPVQGINLKNLFSKAEDALLQEKEADLVAKIKVILAKRESAFKEVENAEKQLASKKTELEKHDSKLALIKKGDWSVLKESQKENQNDGQVTS